MHAGKRYLRDSAGSCSNRSAIKATDGDEFSTVSVCAARFLLDLGAGNSES
jgi:hypothetical protein